MLQSTRALRLNRDLMGDEDTIVMLVYSVLLQNEIHVLEFPSLPAKGTILVCMDTVSL